MTLRCWLPGGLTCALLVSCILPVEAIQAANSAQVAKEITDATGFKGGVIVHIGCGDAGGPGLTAALAAGGNCIVHALDTDAENVQNARRHIRELGLYGSVSVECFDGRHLPYADNLVNLIVTENLGDIAMDEVMRVLAPGGVLYARQGNGRSKTVKPHPYNTDEWTHFLHDASGNAVAHDEVVGPPRRLQWIAAPRHMRSHEHIPGIYALVSTGGRIFYIADQAPIASIRQSARWHIIARDAYNGILLWERPITAWFPHIVNWGVTPRQLQRRLVAVDDRVYVTLGLHAQLSALDATTGRTVKVYRQTFGTEEIVCHKGILLLVVGRVGAERKAELEKWAQLTKQDKSPLYARETAQPLVNRFRSIEAKAEKTVLALDADTGRLLWKKTQNETSGLRANTLCADGDRLLYQNGKDVVCLDLLTGRRLWSTACAPLRLVYNDSVFCAGGQSVTALSVDDGKARWTQPLLLTDIRDTFFAGGSLWLGGFKPCKGKRGPSWGPYFATQRNPATGKVLMHIEPENPSHHHRCYFNKATDRYILGGRRGTEFIDLQTGDVLWNSWVRGVCKYGVMPANGLLYAPPHACGCYIAAKLTGFYALAPEGDLKSADHKPDDDRLEQGPAFEASPNLKSQISNLKSKDWPTYRHDARRSAATKSSVPAALRPRWQVDIGGKLTACTVAGGRVFAASVDEHRVCALDADSGRLLWDFTTGGRVDSPPTVYGDRAIFGCRDGCVYSLRTSDGALAWRLRATGAERLITAHGQLESAWPIPASVLIRDGVVYFTAGRSSYLDGGMILYRVAPATGKILSTTRIYSPDPETDRQPAQSGPAYMPGQLSEILTADDQYVYLRDTVFDRHGDRQANGNPHLLTLTGFLDDSWAHRSYWIFGRRCSLATGCSGRERNLIYGRLLVLDHPMIYGYGRSSVHWSNQLQDGAYRLFARNLDDNKEQWTKHVSVQIRAMLLADKVLFIAGPPAAAGNQPQGADRKQPAVLMAVSAADGKELARCRLDSSPVFDGLAAAGGRLYVSLENGQVCCMTGR